MDDIVCFKQVCKSFGNVQVLNGVSFTVAPGEVVALIGRSGSGKTTALRCINGLENIQSGELYVCGHAMHTGAVNLLQLRQEVGIVFQSYNLFPHLTTLQNVTLALRKVKGMARPAAEALGMQMLHKVDMQERAHYYPEQLSGGQQQRAAIARSLAMQPKLMLFDEVTSALDPELTGEVLRAIERLAKDGMSMVLVTHEMAFARDVSSEVIYLYQGQIEEQGPPEQVMLDPISERCRQFVLAEANR